VGGINPFPYAINNPLAYYDQYGLWLNARQVFGGVLVGGGLLLAPVSLAESFGVELQQCPDSEILVT